MCVVSIPDGETRYIKDRPVFYVTALFSIFAYMWLILILQMNTPNVVDVWEGVVSFMLFPLLVYIAYLADQQVSYCCGKRSPTAPGGHVVAMSKVSSSPRSQILTLTLTLILALNLTQAGHAIELDDARDAYDPSLSAEAQVENFIRTRTLTLSLPLSPSIVTCHLRSRSWRRCLASQRAAPSTGSTRSEAPLVVIR